MLEVTRVTVSQIITQALIIIFYFRIIFFIAGIIVIVRAIKKVISEKICSSNKIQMNHLLG